MEGCNEEMGGRRKEAAYFMNIFCCFLVVGRRLAKTQL